ncbi:MAG: hypothetical protein GC201_00160 [Alphaproteobacteria bacterium]|nr:hypothetical protein [Alphaproteobacteria bacterium]
MADKHTPFPAYVQKLALARQKFRCASCGTRILGIGKSGAQGHTFGEGAEGHHVIPHKMGGPITLENCVVLCRSCHLSAHQGGLWADTCIYRDVVSLPMPQQIARIAALYPHYSG